MIVLIDTTVLIDVLRGIPNRRKMLAKLVEAGHTLATTALNVGEVYGGMRPEEELQTATLFASLECYSITADTARHAGALQKTWARKGRTLTLADMFMAVVALELTATLITSNRKDFPIPELKFLPLD